MTRHVIAYPTTTVDGRPYMRVVATLLNCRQDMIDGYCTTTEDVGRLLIVTNDPRPQPGARLPRGVQGDRTWFPRAA